MKLPSVATLHSKWVFALCLLAAGAQLAAQISRRTYDGRTEPFLDNDEVIINSPRPWPGAIDAVDIPAALTARFGAQTWHNHRLNRVLIYFTGGGEIIHFLDGSTEELHWHPGLVKWSEARGFHYTSLLPGMADMGDRPPGTAGLMDVGIKKPGFPGKVGGGALDPLRVDPKDFELEFENSQVRVLHLRMGPRQSVPMHEYTLNHLIVYITDGNELRETSPEGKAEVKKHPARDFRWEGPSRQTIDNLSAKPLEAVVVEMKSMY